ncbi:MAG TPA: DNA polymerase I [Planctomycetes bacterium]|nr:DNA polymerase I [Planctomycetota bacterium]
MAVHFLPGSEDLHTGEIQLKAETSQGRPEQPGCTPWRLLPLPGPEALILRWSRKPVKQSTPAHCRLSASEIVSVAELNSIDNPPFAAVLTSTRKAIPLSQTLFLIDGRYQIYRGFYGMRRLTDSRGMQVQAIYAIADLLLRLCRDHPVDLWAIAMECDGPTFRHDRYDQYKANREEMPEELSIQLPFIDRLLEAFRIPILQSPHHEADDCIATMATRAASEEIDVRLLTKDKDLEQVLSDRVKFLDVSTGQLYGPEELLEKKGIEPQQVIAYQSLVGDSSDNIPGVKGIGAKGAEIILSLVEDPATLLEDPVPDGIPAASLKKIRACPEMLHLSKELVTLSQQTPLDCVPTELIRIAPDETLLSELFKELGFNRFLKMMSKPVEQQASLFAGADTDSDTGAAASGGDGSGAQDHQPPPLPDDPAVEYHLVTTIEELDQIVERCRQAGSFAFDTETNSLDQIGCTVVGCSIAVEAAEAWYIPFQSPSGEGPIARKDVMERLGPLLEDAAIGKIGQNIKFDAQVMRNEGVILAGICGDPMISSYLINPVRGRYGLDGLVAERLAHTMIPIREIIGERGSEISMDQIEPEKICHYAAEDADWTLRLHRDLDQEIDQYQLREVLEEIELPLIEVLVAMEREGISIDEDRLKEQGTKLSAELELIESRIHEEAGEPFNIASPKQLQKVLFEDLKLPKKGLPSTKTGTSVKAETLEELASRHPDQKLPALILRHRSLSKLISTYVMAIPQHLHPGTGRIHTDFRQTVTATGRLASNRPNLQNIPIRSDEGRRIRQAFIPNREGCIFVCADYSQVELRLLAHLTGDEGLISTIESGIDIHASVAAKIHDKEIDAVSKDERSAAKAVNFGLMYGMGARGLARDIGISIAEAKEFIESYFDGFPRVRDWMEETKRKAIETGEVRTLCGRRRPIPEILSRLPREKAQGERYAINTVVQGSAADLIKKAMIDVHREALSRGNEARILLQIHDELLLEVPEHLSEECAIWLKEVMEAAMKISVPLEVQVSMGRDWFDASK